MRYHLSVGEEGRKILINCENWFTDVNLQSDYKDRKRYSSFYLIQIHFNYSKEHF